MFRSRGRRASPYELAQISICRSGLAMGLSDCGSPDQFFHCLVNSRDWQRPLVTGSGLPADVNVVPAHSSKDIVVRGIQFDYQYSYTPQSAEDAENDTGLVGVTSIRSALVKMRVAPGGSAGEFENPLPVDPLSNILFHGDTLLRQNTTVGPVFTNFEGAKKYRIMWRGMEMMGNVIAPFGFAPSFRDTVEGQIPHTQTASRHVRVRTSVRLAHDEGLFFVTETVNPFLSDNPVIALDLFGSLVVKIAPRGTRHDT